VIYFKLLSLSFLRGKPRKIDQDTRSPGRESNPEAPEYAVGLVTTQL